MARGGLSAACVRNAAGRGAWRECLERRQREGNCAETHQFGQFGQVKHAAPLVVSCDARCTLPLRGGAVS